MKKTDTERLKKIVSLWDALSSEIERRGHHTRDVVD